MPSRGGWIGHLLCLLLLGHTRSGDTAFIVEEAALVLVNTSVPGLPISLATFGIPQYGRYVTGLLEYSSSAAGRKECDFVQERFPTQSQPFILLLDRGDCKFTVKAMHAQRAGAIAVLMVDDRVEFANGLFTMDSGEDDQSQLEAANVTIPVALLREDDGAMLKTMLRKPRVGPAPRITVSLDYTHMMRRQATVVPLNLWLTSDDSCGVRCQNQLKFVADVRETASSMIAENRISFSVHYPVYPCPDLAKDCPRRCTNSGKFCALPPSDQGKESTLYGGRDVVIQNLRSVCVFDQASDMRRMSVWWTYVANMASKCSFAKKTYSDACAQAQAAAAGADVTRLRQCMGSTDTRDNVRLQQEADKAVSVGQRGDIMELLLPSVSAWGVQYRGNLAAAPVVQFVCSGFCGVSAPAVCPRGLASKPCPASAPVMDYTSSSDSTTSSTSSESSTESSSTESSTGAAGAPSSSTSTSSGGGSSSFNLPPATGPSPAPQRMSPPPWPVAAVKPSRDSRGGNSGAATGIIIALVLVAALGGGGWWWYKNKYVPRQGQGGVDVGGGWRTIEMS